MIVVRYDKESRLFTGLQVFIPLVGEVGITDLTKGQALFTLQQELERRILLRGRVEGGRVSFCELKEVKGTKNRPGDLVLSVKLFLGGSGGISSPLGHTSVSLVIVLGSH